MISCRVPWQNHDFGTSTNILARKSKAKGLTLLNSFKGLSFFLPDLFWNFTGRERKPGKLDFKHVWCILCFCTKKRTAKNQGLAKLRWWSPFFTGSLAAKNIPGSNQQVGIWPRKRIIDLGKIAGFHRKNCTWAGKNWWSLQLIKVLNIFPPATLVAFGSRSNTLLQFTMEPQIVGESHFWWFRNAYPKNNGWIFWMTIFLPLVHSDVLSCSLYLANAWKKRPSQGTWKILRFAGEVTRW